MLNVLKPSPVDYSASIPMVWSTAKDYEGKADKKEKWYGTPYQASQRFFAMVVVRCVSLRFPSMGSPETFRVLLPTFLVCMMPWLMHAKDYAESSDKEA